MIQSDPIYKRLFVCIAALFMLYYYQVGFAQNSEAVESGIVRIKVHETLARDLEQSKMTRTRDRVVITGIESLDNLNRRFGVTNIKRVFRPAGKFESKHRRYGLHLWYEITLDKNISIHTAISTFKGLPRLTLVEAVHKKKIIGSDQQHFGPVVIDPKKLKAQPSLPGASNDPLLAQQWHYNNTGQTSGTPGADIKLYTGWGVETGRSAVVVAVTDGGIETNHPDLAANMWINPGEIPGNDIDDDNNGFQDDIHGYSFVDNAGSIEPDDHGTHVGGTVAAVTNNGIGVAGVAGGSGSGDGVRLMSCAVFSSNGAGGFAESYVYAADNGAVISQNSWGYWYPGVFEQSVLDAIDYFIAEAGRDENGVQTGPMDGGLVVFAAGNADSDSHFFPGYYEPTFSVAGTNHRDVKSWYSNYGPWVDIAAPGGETDVVETEGVLSTLTNGTYGFYQGTSMACPHVSGLAALLVSKHTAPGLQPTALRNHMMQTADNIDAVNPAYAGEFGGGRINAGRALQPDDVAPDAIDDLSIADIGITELTLSWTVPWDGDKNFITIYDVRYAPTPITNENFSDANAASINSTLEPSDSTQTVTITGLEPGTSYYFAVKAIDYHGNTSPISNIVEQATDHAPVFSIHPTSITEALVTAETSQQHLTIGNTGLGVLEFVFTNASASDNFATPSPAEGTVAPGDSLVVTVTISAHNRFEGTYEQELVLHTNDPENQSHIIPVTLNVTNNNAPIATVTPDSINFKAVQTGSSLEKFISVHNAGSDTLIITNIVSDHTAFTPDTTFATIAPFDDQVIGITFTPPTTGQFAANITLHTSDPSAPDHNVSVRGEGLSEPPVVADPDSIYVEAPIRTTVTQTLTLYNNGSEDRTYQIDIQTNGVILPPVEPEPAPPGEEEAAARKSTTPTSVGARLTASQGKEIDPLWKPVRESKSSASASARVATLGTDTGHNYYFTDFEDFELGSIHDQKEWFALQGWVISDQMPDTGTKHLRGNSDGIGGESYAFTPVIVDIFAEDNPLQQVTTMRVNLDRGRGTTWEIIPEGGYVITRLRINADGTMDALTGGYDGIWAPVNATIPEGYFDLAISYNGGGNDTTSFSISEIYINQEKVFTGYGIGMGIGDVAFISHNEVAGATLEVDDLKVYMGEFIPDYVKAQPSAGIIPAGGSVDVTLTFDTEKSALNYGTYDTDVLVRVDDDMTLTVPTTLSITGDPKIRVDPNYPMYLYVQHGQQQIDVPFFIRNRGGSLLTYEISEDIDYVSVDTLTGSVPVRSYDRVQLLFELGSLRPGVYIDSMKITSNDPDLPVTYLAYRLTIAAPDLRVEPESWSIELTKGEYVTHLQKLFNEGDNYLTWSITYKPAWLTTSVTSGSFRFYEEFSVRFDSRNLAPGIHHDTLKIVSNDPLKPMVPIPIVFTVKERPQEILSFTLINVRTGEEIATFKDGITFNLAHQSLQDLNVRANVSPAVVGSVKFRINGKQVNIDNSNPYMLKTGFFPTLAQGTHTLFAEPWTEGGGKGQRGTSLQVVINIINNTSQSISYFTLINSRTGEVITAFDDRITIDRADADFNYYHVHAHTLPAVVGSVKFRIDGVQRNIDNDPPYRLAYWSIPSLWPLGNHQLMGVPYTLAAGKGTRGLENHATITLIDSRSNTMVARLNTDQPEEQEFSEEDVLTHDTDEGLSLYPVPVIDDLQIQFEGKVDGDAELTILNVHGQPVYQERVTAAAIQHYRISTQRLGLSTGAYYVVVQTVYRRQTRKFMKQ